jgi:hypothetical protein
MVDDNVLLADLGRREPPLAELDLQGQARLDHLLSDNGVACLDCESAPQPLRFVAGGLIEPRQLDALEAIVGRKFG